MTVGAYQAARAPRVASCPRPVRASRRPSLLAEDGEPRPDASPASRSGSALVGRRAHAAPRRPPPRSQALVPVGPADRPRPAAVHRPPRRARAARLRASMPRAATRSASSTSWTAWSVNPRVAIRFSGPVALDSVTQASAFILPLAPEPLPSPIGLGQLVWDAATHTLYARPERAPAPGAPLRAGPHHARPGRRRPAARAGAERADRGRGRLRDLRAGRGLPAPEARSASRSARSSRPPSSRPRA